MATSIAGSFTSYFRVHEYRSLTVLVTLFVFSQLLIAVSGNAVHLTMVTTTPYGAGLLPVSFSCLRSSPDTNTGLSFGRPFKIGIPGSSIQTVTTLPIGASLSTSPSAVTQSLPISVDSIGLFYCEGSNSGMTTRVFSIIHSHTRRFEPVDGLVTKTVNRGEVVTLSVSSVNGLGTAPIWRRIRNGNVDDLSSVSGQNTLAITVPSFYVMDGDLYTVIQSSVSVNDNHFGMIRLIVRGCSAGQWGPPACAGMCNQCYNGGVCDDETGQCVCAPGFRGQNCLTACGMHKFGWDCEFQCGPGNLITSCTGSQFGLPDPYGSSCISGYSGRDCDTMCPYGSFGAGCTQTCHCLSGTCNIYTGVCSSGCADGWSGVNCQVAPDTVAPVLVGCPSGTLFFTIPVGQVSTFASWNIPTATDNVDPNPTVTPSRGPGIFIAGTYTITYTARDASSNTAICQFTVQINQAAPCDSNQCQNGATCLPQGTSYFCSCRNGFRGMYCQTDDQLPPVIDCPDPINLNLPQGNSDVVATWTEPSTSETTGVSQNKTHEPGSRFRPGETTVTYTFTDQAGNSAICTFNVTVSALPMLSHPPVVNVEPTSATVTWQAWNNAMDTGDGPIIAYVVYFTPMEDSNWVSAGSITDTTQATYSFLVKNLEPATEYSFSVAAVRDGQGGEGPRGPSTRIQTLPPNAGAVTTQRITLLVMNEAPSTGSSTIIVIICVIVVVVILVMGFLVYFLRVRKRRHQHPKPHESTRNQEMTSYENEITPDDKINTSATDYEPVSHNQASAYEPVGGVRSSTTYEDVGLPTWAKPWNVPWDNFMLGTKVLGKGQFGEVRYGGVMIEGEFCKAAIKKLQEYASIADRQNFLDEFHSMTKIRRHPNIVRIIGACQHEGELYVAMEYLPNGDLRSYLRNARSVDGEESLSSDKLLQFALDVAKGMQHLAASGVIHRDLAARNILLDDNLVAKISDFGLSRGEDIYVQVSMTRVPTRWLSLESLTNQTYTTKSDVWSYGILLWEIATVGGTPYTGIRTGVLMSELKTGYRMPKPTNCDIKIYDLMLKCWQEKPSERPSFKKIVSVLTTMTENQDDEIYMSLLPRSEEHKYVNISPEFDDN